MTDDSRRPFFENVIRVILTGAALSVPATADGQCEPAFIGSRAASLEGTFGGKGLAAASGWVAVGAPLGSFGSGPGYVTLMQVDSSGLHFDTVISDPAADAQAYFGFDCSLSGNRLVISAGDPYGVRVYEYDTGIWQLRGYANPDAGPLDNNVSLDGDVLLLGAPFDSRRGTDAGGASIIRRGSDGVWRQEATLFAPDPKKGAYFGIAVALSGNVALIGAEGDDTLADGAGAAYLFRFNGVSWAFEQKLLPDAPSQFGLAVALRGDVAAVTGGSGGMGGACYVYRQDGSSWVREALLRPDEFGEGFGADVAVGDSVVAVGDQADDEVDMDSGAVSIFRRVSGEWRRVSKVFSPDPHRADFFGVPLAVDRDFLVAQDDLFSETKIDAFDISCCPPDCNGDGVLNINDFICFQSEWRKRSAYGDYNHDGLWNINDFIAFQADWRTGCL